MPAALNGSAEAVRQRLVVLATVGLAAGAGVIAASPQLLSRVGVPTSVLYGIALLGAAAGVGLRNPLVVVGLFVAWLPLGDLVRKLGTGDPRISLIRDVLLLLAIVAVTLRYAPWRQVTAAFRGWWMPLVICVAYFCATGVASIFNSWQIPLSGLRLYFGALPLVGVGFVIGRDANRLRIALIFGSIVMCVGTSVGIIQAFIGPEFLAPTNDVDEIFTHLTLQRSTVGQSAPTVFQPTGFFVEPGRFANWAFVNLALGLAIYEARASKRSGFVVLSVGILGIFASAGRGIIVASLMLIGLVMLRHLRTSSRRFSGSVARLALVAAAVVVVGLAVAPDLIRSRTEFLSLSLNPFSSTSEAAQRTPGYLRDTFKALSFGGLFGRGLGVQSLGTQYLTKSSELTPFGEGGFVTVAVETGVVGLMLWVWWTAAWCRRVLSLASRANPAIAGSLAAFGYAISMLLFVKFWFGINAIQDYVTNIAFFMGCGVVLGLNAAFSPVNEDYDAYPDNGLNNQSGSPPSVRDVGDAVDDEALRTEHAFNAHL